VCRRLARRIHTVVTGDAGTDDTSMVGTSAHRGGHRCPARSHAGLGRGWRL
jgi:hypothetical protein